MQEICSTCGDVGTVIEARRDNLRQQAQKIAHEKKEPMAICEDESNGSFYIIAAFKAISERHKYTEIISGL